MVLAILVELEKAHTEKGGNKSGGKKDHGQPGNGFHANAVTLRITGDAEAGEGIVGCHPALGLYSISAPSLGPCGLRHLPVSVGSEPAYSRPAPAPTGIWPGLH